MCPAVREAQELVLDRRAIPGPVGPQPSGDEGGTPDVRPQDLISSLRGPGEPAGVVRPMEALFPPQVEAEGLLGRPLGDGDAEVDRSQVQAVFL